MLHVEHSLFPQSSMFRTKGLAFFGMGSVSHTGGVGYCRGVCTVQKRVFPDGYFVATCGFLSGCCGVLTLYFVEFVML